MRISAQHSLVNPVRCYYDRLVPCVCVGFHDALHKMINPIYSLLIKMHATRSMNPLTCFAKTITTITTKNWARTSVRRYRYLTNWVNFNHYYYTNHTTLVGIIYSSFFLTFSFYRWKLEKKIMIHEFGWVNETINNRTLVRYVIRYDQSISLPVSTDTITNFKRIIEHWIIDDNKK